MYHSKVLLKRIRTIGLDGATKLSEKWWESRLETLSVNYFLKWSGGKPLERVVTFDYRNNIILKPFVTPISAVKTNKFIIRRWFIPAPMCEKVSERSSERQEGELHNSSQRSSRAKTHAAHTTHIEQRWPAAREVCHATPWQDIESRPFVMSMSVERSLAVRSKTKVPDQLYSPKKGSQGHQRANNRTFVKQRNKIGRKAEKSLSSKSKR